ncbi:C-X-C chemokine receptor type 5 [Sardina pilchardus]|uniref:C-X-C chemokine receptor type 5 n=1 Tax=Sardina pilchardus TaxID=27697 RepID=UPI002E165D5B
MSTSITVLEMDQGDVFFGEDDYNYSSSYEDESNGTYEYDCAPEEGQLRLFQTVLLPLVYSAVFLLGVAGNGLMVALLLRRRRGSLRITEIYLLHLGLADLLFLAALPLLAAKQASGWLFGVVLCKLLSALVSLNLLCSSLLLACISFDRYLAIVHAVPSVHSRRPRTVHLTCGLLWLLCVGLAAPEAAFATVVDAGGAGGGPQCSYAGLDGANWTLLSRALTHLLGFFVPLGVMAACYSAVVRTLCRRRHSLEQRGAVRLALLVTAVFCLCWLPFNLTKLLELLVILGPLAQLGCAAALKQSLVLSESLGYVHCCLNPVLYAFAGVRFRKELLRLLGRWKVCHRCVPAHCSSRVSSSDGVTTTTTVKPI